MARVIETFNFALREVSRGAWTLAANPRRFDAGWDVLIAPKLSRLLSISDADVTRSRGAAGEFVQGVFERIRTAQGEMLDELDKSIGREPRPETPVEHRGRCRYCGAPWEPEERKKR